MTLHQNFTEVNSNEDQTVAFGLSVKTKSKIGPIPGQKLVNVHRKLVMKNIIEFV